MGKKLAATLGENVARLRRERRLTQTQLAKACGFTRSTINEIEGGHGNPELSTLSAIACALKLPAVDLLQSHQEQHNSSKSPLTYEKRWRENSNPDNIIRITEILSQIEFVTAEEFMRYELKYPRSQRSRETTFQGSAQIVNGTFSATAVDAAYLIARKPTRHFENWCKNIAERSEELLTSVGYAVLPLDEPHAVWDDWVHRTAPQAWQIFHYLKFEYLSPSENRHRKILHEHIKLFDSQGDITRPKHLSQEVVKSIHILIPSLVAADSRRGFPDAAHM